MAAVGTGVGMVVAGPIVDLLGYQLAVLAADDRPGGGGGRGALLRPGVAGPRRRAGSTGSAALLLSGWLVALLLPVSRGAEVGLGFAAVLGLLAVAVVLAAAWVVVEPGAPVPLIDMTMMRRRGGVDDQPGRAAVRRRRCTPPSRSCRSSCRLRQSAGYGFGASITESGLLLLPQTVAASSWGSTPAGSGSVRRQERADRRHRSSQRPATCSSPSRTTHLGALTSPRSSAPASALAFSAMAEPDRRRRAARADRRRQRHERQHPHDRRLHRRPR